MSALLLLAAHLAAPVLAARVMQVELEPAVVKMERRAGVELWTVRAEESSVRQLLARVGELSGREIRATSALERAPLVTIALERRPLEELLEFALGSAGLCAELAGDEVFVRADRCDDDTLDRRLELAASAWARAAARHPRHASAASARLAQGQLDELRGHPQAARSFYLDVLTRDPGSHSAGEAYLRAGRLAAGRGDWSEAAEHFRALANLDGAEEYRGVARIELARSTLRLGDPRGALHILDTLEADDPAWERTEATARSLVRVEALLAARRCQDALLELEAQSASYDTLGAREVPRLRALALEGADLFEDASRAWLLVAREARGPERAEAYRSAADAAARAGEPLDVRFVAREARATGFGAAVADLERRAQDHLGTEPSGRDVDPSVEARLARAERWIREDELERASDELEPLWAEREQLVPGDEQRVRVTLAWVRCLRPVRGIEEAAALAAAERPRLGGAARGTLDRGMARLFQDCALFERAADAYQGEYGP